ncbi:neuroligin [Rhyzopertha dominica]|nr:neuroligin [Rhyzopertha dominica]
MEVENCQLDSLECRKRDRHLIHFLCSLGLFHRVVLLSGTALSPWATIHNADALRVSIGQQTGCLSSTEPTDEDIAPCLRSRPLQALTNAHLESVRFMPGIAPSLPTDEETPDPAFAMEHASENFITCELMLGTTTTESYNDFNAADIQYGFEEDQRNKILRTYIRNAYVYHLNEIFSAVRNEYTDWDKPIQHPINIRDSTMEALSDGHTVSPLVRVAYVHARRGAKTYFFHFGYQTKDSEYPQRLGSVRGEDLTYILGMPLVGGMPFFPQNFSRQDMGVAEAVLNFFSNFAKSGDPNGQGINKDVPDYGTLREKTRYRGITWEPYEVGTQFYLSITLKPKMKSHYRGHKMAVWLNLIPQLHQPGDDDVSMRHHHFHEREPHYYAGAVRAESFTKLPPLLHPASMTDPHLTSGSGTECIPNTTSDDELGSEDMVIADEEEETEILQRLTNRHYYSYTAALGVTVGVGCILLMLNMLIFAGIYYQRERDKRRQSQRRSSRGTPAPSTENIAMTQRPSSPCGSSRQSPVLDKHELPPCYSTLTKNDHSSRQSTLKKEKPLPPVRTSSNPSGGTIKKRVQIQEISV